MRLRPNKAQRLVMPKKNQQKPMPFLTPLDAQMLCDTHDIDQLFTDREERELLAQHNPELLELYEKLRSIAAYR